MRKIKFSVFVFVCVLLHGCGGAEGEARKAVLEHLKDPDSAKFGQFTQVDEQVACLTVNAKNSVGGYIGNEQALLKRNDGKWEFYAVKDISHDECVQQWPKAERRLSAGKRLEAVCAEQKAMGEEYSKMSESICRYGDALSDDQKLEFVDAWDKVKVSLSKLNDLKAQRQ
ncbi:hypothetical protein PS647_04158 [Pseudomonas fluorescens]|uniref:hypothetical protein n=1 Tax=Pseudomonas fluorescens TaxID=294 RepID=UPI00123FF110|nr:hypothetical protein [Pseudomonas fluorescens]VVN17103.1 hypothetical protein PS647_04158 [Pseudomonas fluorescens]